MVSHMQSPSGCIRIDSLAAIWTEEHLAKWDRIDTDEAACTICTKAIDTSEALSFALCHADDSPADCEALMHLSCLSKRFLSLEASTSSLPPPLLPDRGTCPSCSIELRWGDVIRGCYRLHTHLEDGGKGRATRKRREKLRNTKLEKLIRGEISSDSEASSNDEAEEGAKAKARKKAAGANKPRTKKVASVLSDSDATVEPRGRGRPCKTVAKGKGKSTARAISPVAEQSDTPDLFLEVATLAGSDALSDVSDAAEATDEERELAYAAAADGSLEMRAGDISPDSSGTLQTQMALPQSPAKRKKKAHQAMESPSSPEKKARITSRGKKAATEPVVFVEISDTD